MSHVHLPAIDLDWILLTRVLGVLVCSLAARLGVEGHVPSYVCILGLLAWENSLECCLGAAIVKGSSLRRSMLIQAIILWVLPGLQLETSLVGRRDHHALQVALEKLVLVKNHLLLHSGEPRHGPLGPNKVRDLGNHALLVQDVIRRKFV
jgi:hypothetical protein